MGATDRRVVQREIFERFEAVFGNLRKDPEAKKILAKEYFRMFNGCPDDVVSKVADKVIDEHEDPGWPKPATVRRAIRFLAPQGSPGGSYASGKPIERGPTTPAILGTRAGQSALEHGHGSDLVIRCRELGKLPDDATLVESNRAHREAIEVAEELQRREVKSPAAIVCLKLWKGMVEKEERLRSQYFRQSGLDGVLDADLGDQSFGDFGEQGRV
jgi:hypothetical protein